VRRRIPPWRRCLDCGCRVRGWAEHTTRCDRCQRVVKARGALGLEPGGVAEAARQARLERFAATEQRIET